MIGSLTQVQPAPMQGDPLPAYQTWVRDRRRRIAEQDEVIPTSPRQVFEAGWKAAAEALGAAAREAAEAEVASRTSHILAVRRVAELPLGVQEDVRRRHVAHVARLLASGLAVMTPEASEVVP